MSRRDAVQLGAWLVVLTAAGCGSTGPAPVPACSATAASAIALAVGADTALDPAPGGGCVTFPANASTIDSMEYLVVAQSAGGVPGAAAPFELRSATLSPAPPVLLAAAPALGRSPIAATFDHFLRGLGRAGAISAPAAAAPRSGAPAAAATPPAVGSLRSFWVCADLSCNSFKKVTARARAVGAHVAIYVDTLAPPNGLDSTGIDSLKQVFDTHVYVVDTTAFAGVSDIDGNGVVIALMTNVVNAIVTKTQCAAGGFIAGFFFPPDLAPGVFFGDSSNDGEIFYTIVADPNATLSCTHSASDVERFVPSVFAHELQHMISFDQHFLVRNGLLEDDWLDEGLSKYAEELAGRSFLPADSATFSDYAINDVIDAYQFLTATGGHFLLTTTDTSLADVGAGWLYMRYLVDQFGDSLTNKLEQTSFTGTGNVQQQTLLPFATTATRWALANWVSDLSVPGFTAPPTLQYTSWHFRRTYASLNLQDPTLFPLVFPLVPTISANGQVALSGTLHAGSGTYVRVLQAPGAPAFGWLFSGGGTAPPAAGLVPRLDVIRIR
jgi:hypothetical protein